MQDPHLWFGEVTIFFQSRAQSPLDKTVVVVVVRMMMMALVEVLFQFLFVCGGDSGVGMSGNSEGGDDDAVFGGGFLLLFIHLWWRCW